MKHLTTSRKLIAVFAVAAILGICYVLQLRAFTLVELLLGTVPLKVSQALEVIVSNTTDSAAEIHISILNAMGTVVFGPKAVTVAAHNSLPFRFQNGSTPGTFSARISGDLSSVVADIGVVGGDGGVIAVLPAVQSIAAGDTIYTPPIQLQGGQGGAIYVTNNGSDVSQYALQIFGSGGGVVKSASGAIQPGHSVSVPFKHAAGLSASTFRAVIANTGGGGSLSADGGALDISNGNIIALVPALSVAAEAALLLPAVQLDSGQGGAIFVSNTSDNSADVSVSTINAAGQVQTQNITLAGLQTVTDPFQNTGNGTLTLTGSVIAPNGLNGIVADIGVFGSNGGIIAISPPTQNILSGGTLTISGSVLLDGQKAVLAVTNTGAALGKFNFVVHDQAGKSLVTKNGLMIKPKETLTFRLPKHELGTFDASVTNAGGNGTTVASDFMVFDPTTGSLVVIALPQPEP